MITPVVSSKSKQLGKIRIPNPTLTTVARFCSPPLSRFSSAVARPTVCSEAAAVARRSAGEQAAAGEHHRKLDVFAGGLRRQGVV
ncbi:MAG: hypothetical protein BJ554DRAFT_1934 [Olpidium bornovanus]|uniref:Uncharacterized protein n=1 Tax=Olpidium bornovanus TaxID=278681 RepID=A0A8H8DHA8_9FUNG|nr:MAG: hypothetical protein BJ554DRAFT_1934 [Olpidium bornovanus]